MSQLPPPTSSRDIPPASEIFVFNQLNGIDLEELSIDSLQTHIAAKSFTSTELTAWCLERISATNPYLNCVTEINPDALEIAKSLDAERRDGSTRGPLHGIPVLVKDNIATADKMQTTAGSLSLVGSIVPRDAHVIKNLREAGAIILGHSNMCEWASMRSSQESIGYSPRGGQVRNPYNLSTSAWGSSSGSAVAVASSIVPLSLGTETDTSVIGCAYHCGLVGIKPTVGVTSRSGVVPISENMDTVGAFGRSVRDAVYGLQAIAGPDPRDSFTLPISKHTPDYVSFLEDKSVLRDAVFGLPQKRIWDNVDPDLLPVYISILQNLQLAGARLVEVDIPSWHDRISPTGWDWNPASHAASESEYRVCAVDFYNNLKLYLSELSNTNIRSLEDVIAFNNAHPELEGARPGDNPAFPSGHDTLLEVAKLRGVKDDTYFAALSHIQRRTREEGIDAALIYQTSIPPNTTSSQALSGPLHLDALLIPDRKCAGQQLAAQAGYPIICIPVGVDSKHGRPFGLSLQQTAWQEGKLIRFASAIEDLLETVKRRPRPLYREYLAKNIPVIS